jgi:hypothetical protein
MRSGLSAPGPDAYVGEQVDASGHGSYPARIGSVFVVFHQSGSPAVL